jgi:hypothetical protein
MYLSDSPTFLGHLIDSHIIAKGGNHTEWEIGITNNPEQIKIEYPESEIFETANKEVAIATQEFMILYRRLAGVLIPSKPGSSFIYVRKKQD